MASPQNEPRDCVVKVVLMGAAGSGRAAIIKAVAAKYAHASVRAGELGEGRIFRTEFFWPEALQDGRRLRIRLFGLSGRADYNAMTELLLCGVSGIVFSASLARDQGFAAQDALAALLFNASHHRMDLSTLPMSLQYHALTNAPVFAPEEMDELLSISPGSLPRFVANEPAGEARREAVDCVIAELRNRMDVPAPSRGKRRSLRRRRPTADAVQY